MLGAMGSRRSRQQRRDADRRGPHSPAEIPAHLPINTAPRWQWWLLALSIALLAAVAYLPTLENDFVTWDDPTYITDNANLTQPGGLKRLWSPGAQRSHQFYPLAFTTYWLEYRVWEFDPRGYHLTNLVLHALNAALLVWVLRLLGVSPWVAWLAAGLFALHPVNVASVAWAAQRKNVLSGLFYLLALALYLRNLRRGSWLEYIACIACFALALLSKTAVLTLPATALLCDRLVLRRWTWRAAARIAPLLVLTLLAAWQTQHIEQANARGSAVTLEPLLRPLVAAGALWFYLGKIIVPVHFPGVYERWDVRAAWPLFVAALATLPVVGLLIWRLRRRIPEHVLWGIGQYLIALGPVLGLIPFNYMQFAFVADHYLYLPGIGAFLAVAVVVDALRRRARHPMPRTIIPTILVGGILITLGACTWRVSGTGWKNPRAFWENTVTMSPNGWVGHYNLANLLRRNGEHARAAEEYALCTRCRPDLHQAWGGQASELDLIGDTEGAIEAYRAALQHVPAESRKWVDYRHRLAGILTRLDRPDEAEALYREAVAGQPHLFRVQYRLARFLRTRGRLDEAATHYERALTTKATPEQLKSARRELAQLRR